MEFVIAKVERSIDRFKRLKININLNNSASYFVVGKTAAVTQKMGINYFNI